MTTKIMIWNEDESSPDREIVVAVHAAVRSPNHRPATVLKPGDEEEWEIDAASALFITERSSS